MEVPVGIKGEVELVIGVEVDIEVGLEIELPKVDWVWFSDGLEDVGVVAAGSDVALSHVKS